MAIDPTRAPRHILYIPVLLALAGGAMCAAACSMADDSEGESAAKPTAPIETRPATPPPAPPEPGATDPQGAAAPGPDDPVADLDPTGYRADDPEAEYDLPRRPARGRKGRPIEIVLRSSPAGAVAMVDGATVGATPTLWEGSADGTPREFTFVLAGYAVARYRFIATRSGIVHATLEPIKVDDKDSRPAANPARPAEQPSPPK